MGVGDFFQDLTTVVLAAGALSWLALVFRQPIIVGYLLCGMIAGPWGLSLVHDVDFIDAIGRVGVTLLLFLAGICLHPQRLYALFKQSAVVTLGTCLLSAILGAGFALAWGFDALDSLLIGLALMFSSTILVIKLLPTTTLHHKHMGAACIAILVAQDLIAVTILMFISGQGIQSAADFAMLPVKGILLLAVGLLVEQFVLRKMMAFCDRFHETLYILSLGWCLGMATLAHKIGFSYEVGAFIAGVALARSPLSLFLSEGLKPFRDFFLVLFFFVLGANLDLVVARAMLVPALLLATLLIITRPVSFWLLFRWVGEPSDFAKETGVRLGQASEFSLVIATMALKTGYMGQEASKLVQLAAIFTMIVSSYWVVQEYPTPMGRKSLQRD